MTTSMRSRLALILCCLNFPLAVPAQDKPSFIGKHTASPQDKQAIEQLLHSYTAAVTDGNEAAFTSLLLNADVPFTATADVTAGADPQHLETRHFGQFRQAVFLSGKHYKQSFYNVRIDQDGPLAQVSLDFLTKVPGSGQGGYGWKVLQLLKVQGQWKIASEFYTAYPLPAQN